MDRRFAESLLHVRHRIAGRTLLPYCAAYEAALLAVESPLVSGGEGVGPADVVYAIAICSSPVDTVTMAPVGMLRPRVGWRGAWELHRCLRSEAAFSRLCKRWADYYADHCAFPELMQAASGSRMAEPLSGPRPLARVCSLLKNFPGIGEHRAWTMPYGLLCWMDAQARELEGGAHFWDAEKDARMDARLREAEEEGLRLLAEQRKRGGGKGGL